MKNIELTMTVITYSHNTNKMHFMFQKMVKPDLLAARMFVFKKQTKL